MEARARESHTALIDFLCRNTDVFAWEMLDLFVVDPEVMSHWLSVNPAVRPIQQRRRNYNDERLIVMEEEVQKLLRVDVITEMQYPTWLCNPVMVQKPNGTDLADVPGFQGQTDTVRKIAFSFL